MLNQLRAAALFLGAIPLLVPVAATAQQGNGRIVGRVLEATGGRPLTGAQVQLENTAQRAVSGVDGRYTITNVPVGPQALVVSHSGFGTKTITDIRVAGGDAVNVDVTLVAEAMEIEGLTVSATRERGTVARALDEQRNATGVVSAITAQQISRSPDSDAAAAVQRISGVTVQDGKYVFVRGLGERYTVTDLNGARLPSPEPERKVVPLDLFPSGILQSITTRKTFTPELSGDFSGALVNIRTREFPADRQYAFSASVGANQAAFGKSVLVAPRAGGELLAAAGSSRAIPEVVEQEGGLNGVVTPQQHNELIGSFRNAWLPSAETGQPNLSLSGSVGGSDPLFGREIGYVVTGTYSRSQEIRAEERRALYDNTDDGESDRFESVQGTGRTGILWGGVANFSTLFADRHRITFNNVYNRTADDEARTERGFDENLALDLEIHRLRYVERSIRSNQVAGEHQLGRTHRIDWALTSSGATRVEPDRSEFIYELLAGPGSAPDQRAFLSGNTYAAVRTWGELSESSVEGSGGYTLTLGSGLREHQIKIGGLVRGTERDAGNRSYSIFASGGSRLLTLEERQSPANEIFDGRYFGSDIFRIRPLLQGGSYQAEDQLGAAYAMADVALTENLRVIGGARLEHSDVKVDVVSQDGTGETINPTYTDVLPSLGLNWDVSFDHKLRLSASQTLARPEYREFVPYLTRDVLGGDNLLGNPDLRRTLVRNLDSRWEWYPSSAEVISLGGFAKWFQDPIERVYLPTSGARVLSWANPESAVVYGVEAELRKELGSLSGALKDLTVSTNLTVMHSAIEVGDDPGVRINDSRSMVGQAPYVANASLTWTPGGQRTSATLLYNRVGERIYAAGALGLPDLVEQERETLDLSLRLGVTPWISAKLDAKNLLNTPFEVTQGPVTREFYRSGRILNLGLTWQP